MKRIGFGILGIGRQGLRLAEHIRRDLAPGELIAVCRRSDEGHEYSRTHGIKFYSNHHDLLQDKDVDVVVITTPSSLHGSQALEAISFNKHLLIDKPIASTIEDAERIKALAGKNHLVVGINFPLRVNPVTRVLKDSLSRIGKLKKVQVIVSHGPPRSAWQRDIRLSSGGVILDLGSHYFDLVYYLSDTRPAAVTSAYSECAENEHSGIIDIAYEGFSASIVLMRNQKLKKNIVSCAGEKGFVFADYALREVIVSSCDSLDEIKLPPSNDFEAILHNMIEAVSKKEPVHAAAEDGILSLKTALAAYRAVETGIPASIA